MDEEHDATSTPLGRAFQLPTPTPGGARRKRRRWVAPLVVIAIVLAAAAAPLPVTIIRPASLVDAGDVVSVTLDESLPNAGDHAVNGRYLGPQQSEGASAARALIAAATPALVVTRDRAAYEPNPHPPAVAAALEGVGITPLRISPVDRPVEVEVSGALHERSLAVALQAFDEAATVDMARGRTIVALGTLGPQQILTCPPRAGDSARAAARAGADVLVAAANCVDAPVGARLIEATAFNEVVVALAAAGG